MSNFRLLERSEERITVSCPCGALYRLPGRLAGGWARCRKCSQRRQVPRQREFTFDTRRLILSEFGIEASRAEQAYEIEKNERCSWCDQRVSQSVRRKDEETLLCRSCSGLLGESATEELDVDVMLAELADLEESEAKQPNSLRAWVQQDLGRAARKTLAYAALYLVGFSCFAHTLLGLAPVDSFLLATIVGGLGSCMVFRGAYEFSQPGAVAVSLS